MINSVSLVPNFNKNISFCAKKRETPDLRLRRDVFVRSGIVSAGLAKDFKNWAKETDFLARDLISILKSWECMIGRGWEHEVYRIPGNNDYVLRMKRYSYIRELDGSKAKITDVSDRKIKDINIGQKVASITFPRQLCAPNLEIEVLKKQEGIPVGVNNKATIAPWEEPFESPVRKKYYAQTMKMLADMPISTYEKLIRDFEIALNAGYNFDFLNSHNILLDSEKQTIGLVDMEHNTVGKRKSTLMDLLYALTNIQYYRTYISQDCEKPTTQEEQEQTDKALREIIIKFMEARKNVDSKLSCSATNEYARSLVTSSPFLSVVNEFSEL